MLLLSLVALAAKPPPIPWPTAASGDPLRIAVVGELASDPAANAALARTILERDPDLLVFTGLDAKADLAAWAGDHGIVAASRTNPRPAFLKRFPGIGTDGRATPYGTLDVSAADTRWRVIYATTWPSPLARWNQQSSWLPGAAEPTAYDRLMVLLDSPMHTGSARLGQPGARVVVDAIQDVTKPIALPLVIAGNTGTNEAFLPGGAFGELHLIAGNSGGRIAEIGPTGGGFVQRPDPAPGAEVLEGAQGYWWVELHGSNIDLSFLVGDGTTWSTRYRLLRDGTGWHLPIEEANERGDPGTLLLLAYHHYIRADYVSAERAYDEYIARMPNDDAAYTNKALIYKRLQKYEEEEALYRFALSLAPLEFTALLNLGLNLAHQKRFDEALAVMKQVEVLDPDDPYAELHRAMIHAEIGNEEQAYAHLRSALERLTRLETLHHIEFRQDIRLDPSFARLRESDRFRALLAEFFGTQTE